MYEVSLKFEKNNGYPYTKTDVHLRYLAELFLEWDFFIKTVVDRSEADILGSGNSPLPFPRLWDMRKHMVERGRPQVTI